MQTYYVAFTLSIDAMNEESAENKLDTFLSALDLKKNEKVKIIEMTDLLEEEDVPSLEAGSTKKVSKGAAEDEDDQDWEDDWANSDWDTLDEEDEDEDFEEESEASEDDESDEVSKLLAEINKPKQVDIEPEIAEEEELDDEAESESSEDSEDVSDAEDDSDWDDWEEDGWE